MIRVANIQVNHIAPIGDIKLILLADFKSQILLMLTMSNTPSLTRSAVNPPLIAVLC